MDVWGWIVLYAGGLALLQLLLYRYLLNRGETLVDRTALLRQNRDAPDGGEGRSGIGPRSPPGDGREFDRQRGSHPDSREARTNRREAPDDRRDAARDPRRVDGDARVCPHCGAENEPDATFDRCWNCTERIG